MAIAVVVVLLAYLPIRLSRGFTPTARLTIFLIVAFKAALLTGLHIRLESKTGHPIVQDLAVDAHDYYKAGVTLSSHGLFDLKSDDLAAVAGGRSHLGYYVVNFLAFKLSPDHPMLFLRLSKLLLFHIALGMLATTWRINTDGRRAFIAYCVLGLIFYQFFYYNFRNLKDDVVLSLFMMIIALADRSLIAPAIAQAPRPVWRAVARWMAIGVLIWAMTTIRYYMGLTVIGAFCIHLVTGRGMRLSYRVMLAGLLVIGFALITTLPGFGLVEEAGGASVVLSALTNVYGLFKVFVTPLPWQHTNIFLAPAHTLYLLMLIPAFWCFFARFRNNLEWKLFVVLQVALVVGGMMQDFEPRKRFVMYPILIGWIVMARRRTLRSQAAPAPPSLAPSPRPGTRSAHTG